jgi:hypothetical protein
VSSWWRSKSGGCTRRLYAAAGHEEWGEYLSDRWLGRVLGGEVVRTIEAAGTGR